MLESKHTVKGKVLETWWNLSGPLWTSGWRLTVMAEPLWRLARRRVMKMECLWRSGRRLVVWLEIRTKDQ